MQHIKHFIFLAVLGFASPSFSEATAPASFEKWGDAGEWEVLVDRAEANGCLIQKLYPDGTLSCDLGNFQWKTALTSPRSIEIGRISMKQ